MNNEAISKYQNLKSLIESEGSFDAKRAESLLNDLKLEFLNYQIFTPKEKELPPENRVMFRDVLEFDALYSIKTKNLDEFERAMAQLKCYYFRDLNLPPSPRMPLLLAIHLVAILGHKETNKTKLVNFSIELQLARDLIGPNEYIDYAADLHQSVVDNSFSRLFDLENKPPSPLFNQFTADLLNGARNNHADSIEHAYTHLTLHSLASILHFSTEEEARSFAKKRNWTFSEDENTVIFQKIDESKKNSSVHMLRIAVELSDQINNLA